MTQTLLPRRLTLIAASLAAFGLSAQVQAGTIEKVKESGAITMGIRESSLPLSYLDDKQQPVGYHVEICQKIVDGVKAKLGLKAVKINYQPVTSQNRIPLVTNGTVDLECGSTTNNAARQQQVAFAPTDRKSVV